MKDFYSMPELVKQRWFPIKSVITLRKLIESGQISAVNVSTTDKFKRYHIPKRAVARWLTLYFEGKIKGELGVEKNEIIKYLTLRDELER